MQYQQIAIFGGEFDIGARSRSPQNHNLSNGEKPNLALISIAHRKFRTEIVTFQMAETLD